MNIFKVLASGKKSFQEETASAILAWLLNPTMEHGLGYSFLSKFMNGILQFIEYDNKNNLFALVHRLLPRFRIENEDQVKLWTDLEYNVETAFIDIVIGINDEWILAVENKIYAGSATAGQLIREYQGVREKVAPLKIGMIYLVPINENSDLLDAKIENEFKELSVEPNDFKAIVTWQKNAIGNIPAIANMIEEILHEESKGIIDPIAEYTRHTLKALNSFISNNFEGYEYERKNTSSGLNPLTEQQLSITELRTKDQGYVGVQGGIRGLLKMGKEKMENHKFQYTTQNMSNKRNWIDLETFKKILQWTLESEVVEIDWKGSFPSNLLYKIARDYQNKVFIGIRGGEEALRKMPNQVIREKEWGISTEQSTAQWINGKVFFDILEEKRYSKIKMANKTAAPDRRSRAT